MAIALAAGCSSDGDDAGPTSGTDATAVPSTPIFIRPAGNQANLYPNPDDVCVATIVAHQPGKVVVVRKPYPVTACAADHEVALDHDGNDTFVISTPTGRPAETAATAGST